MPSTRNTGTVGGAEFTKAQVRFFDFVSFTFPSPTGVIRYTNKPGGFVGNIDGTSQTWVEWDIKVPGLAIAQQSKLDVSWIEIGDNNDVWSSLVMNVGIETRPVTIWSAWFDPSDALLGKFSPYYGRLDQAQIRGKARISITPLRSGLSQLLPARIIGPICGYIYGDARTCQPPPGTTTTFPTCDHTRAACAVRSNLAHFGGFDLLPAINTPTTWRVQNSSS
jgi:hypothetical protein